MIHNTRNSIDCVASSVWCAGMCWSYGRCVPSTICTWKRNETTRHTRHIHRTNEHLQKRKFDTWINFKWDIWLLWMVMNFYVLFCISARLSRVASHIPNGGDKNERNTEEVRDDGRNPNAFHLPDEPLIIYSFGSRASNDVSNFAWNNLNDEVVPTCEIARIFPF